MLKEKQEDGTEKVVGATVRDRMTGERLGGGEGVGDRMLRFCLLLKSLLRNNCNIQT